MLNIEDKIKILNNRINLLTEKKQDMVNYIDLINGGMEDPSLTIDFCNNAIDKYIVKINALNIEKQGLLA